MYGTASLNVRKLKDQKNETVKKQKNGTFLWSMVYMPLTRSTRELQDKNYIESNASKLQLHLQFSTETLLTGLAWQLFR